MLEIGSKFGDYTVIELLGKGAMGAVYRISDGTSDYALKIMSAQFDDPQKRHEWRKRFAREAEVAMKVRHKNLIEVYDVGEDPATRLCYILMEYVGGGTLTDRLKAKGKLDIREAVAITMHIANALSAAHSIGVVHRDIKPDNIMFTTDGVPKLADLGVARYSDSESETTVTKTEMIIGTPAYMSPEQMLNSHNVDARADIYSLGIVFYEMLTGLRPNQGSTIVELMAKAIKGEELPDVRELRPEVSAALSYVLSKMVAQKAENRPASAAEAAKLVYDAANGKLVVKNGERGMGNGERGNGEGGIGNGERKGRWMQLLILSGGLLLAAVAATPFFMYKSRTSQSATEEESVVKTVYVTNVINVVKERFDATSTAVKARPAEGPPAATKTHVADLPRTGDAKSSGIANQPAATGPIKKIEIFPRLDRDKKAWAYSFERALERTDGWEKPGFDDSKWLRAPGGFGHREDQADVRRASINTEWKTPNLYLRRHFNWDGGPVSRAVFELFFDDKVYVYLNGRLVYNRRGSCVYWELGEVDPLIFSGALKKGDNVLCIEVTALRAASYFDCGLRVETGDCVRKALRNDIRKVKTAAGTWTVRIDNGIVCLGNGRDRALNPEPTGELEIPSELDGLVIQDLNVNCFGKCKSLRKVKIPEGVRAIRQFAFDECSELEDIYLPDSVEWIGDKAFFETKLRRLDIKNTGILCDEALDRCALEEIAASPENPTYIVKDGVLYDRVRRAVVKCPVSRKGYKFPKGIEAIYSDAFQWSKLKSVVIPQSVKLVGNAVFHGCSSLESVEFKGDEPEAVDEGLFDGAPENLVVYVKRGAKGWTDEKGRHLGKWPVGDPDARPIRYTK